MTTRTNAPSLSLSIATCSTCGSVWLGVDAFLPLLPTFDSQSPAVGQRSPPSTRGAGFDVLHDSCYPRTWLDTQLSKFWRSVIVAIIDHPTLAAHPPYQWYGFERTGRTTRWSRQRLRRSLYRGFLDLMVHLSRKLVPQTRHCGSAFPFGCDTKLYK